jgi:hypothetical protein
VNDVERVMISRRFWIFLVVALVLAVIGSWVGAWMWRGPMAARGGLYFPKEVVVEVPHFAQGDEAWGGDALGPTPDPLSEVGCAVASAAMVLSGYGVGTDPGRLNEFLTGIEGGYTPQGWIYWEKAAEFEPAMVDRLLPHYEDLPSHYLIDMNLLRGNPVIVRVRMEGGTTHFVVVNGKRGFEYLVVDPGVSGGGGAGLLSEFPEPVEALRFYRKPGGA